MGLKVSNRPWDVKKTGVLIDGCYVSLCGNFAVKKSDGPQYSRQTWTVIGQAQVWVNEAARRDRKEAVEVISVAVNFYDESFRGRELEALYGKLKESFNESEDV